VNASAPPSPPRRFPHDRLSLDTASVNPSKPLRYIEIRASVRIEDDSNGIARYLIAAKHEYPSEASFNPPGSSRVTLHLVPTRIIEH
jgi:hypothetical protein